MTVVRIRFVQGCISSAVEGAPNETFQLNMSNKHICINVYTLSTAMTTMTAVSMPMVPMFIIMYTVPIPGNNVVQKIQTLFPLFVEDS